MPELTLMIDGFPLGAADPDCQIQLLINEDLETAQRVRAAFERTEITRIRNRPKTEQLYPMLCAAASHEPWLLPIMRRLQWNLGGGECAAEWRACLSEMLLVALRTTAEIEKADFLALAEQTNGMAAQPWNRMADTAPALLEQQARIDRLLRVAAEAASRGPHVDQGAALHLDAIPARPVVRGHSQTPDMY